MLPLDAEAGLLRIVDNRVGVRELSAGKNFTTDELGEQHVLVRDLDASLLEAATAVLHDAVQQHPPAVGKQLVAAGEEGGVMGKADVLEGPDADDAIGPVVTLLPTLASDLNPRCAFGQMLQFFGAVGGLLLAGRDGHHVDAERLGRPQRALAVAAADLQQVHPPLEVAFAQRKVDLGNLRLLERHVVALEVSATVDHRAVEE